jgi:hypothetical protein
MRPRRFTLDGRPELKEQDILRQIVMYLRSRNIPVIHIRNTGTINRREDGKVFFGRPMVEQRGVFDLIVCHKGLAWGIEVKKPGGRLSPEQIDYHEFWRGKGGGRVIVAYRFEDVEREFI